MNFEQILKQNRQKIEEFAQKLGLDIYDEFWKKMEGFALEMQQSSQKAKDFFGQIQNLYQQSFQEGTFSKEIFVENLQKIRQKIQEADLHATDRLVLEKIVAWTESFFTK